MAKTIDMQVMRYINLFAKISRVQTTDCFNYNNAIYFAVPKKDMTQALGKNASNVKKVSELLRRKIRVVIQPKKDILNSDLSNEEKTEALRLFVSQIVAPVEFTSFEFNPAEKVITISGSREQKAMMIGRDRSRQKELEEVLTRNFGIKTVKFV